MKYILILSLVMFNFSNAQKIKIDSTNYLLSFEGIHEIDLIKSEIKKETEKWLALTFTDSKEVIRLSNEDNVIGKGSFVENIKSGKYIFPVTFDFVLDIAFKDGRYKLVFKDFQQRNTAVPQPIPVFYKPDLNKDNYIDFMVLTLGYLGNSELLKMGLERIEKGKVKDSEIQNSIEMMEQIKQVIQNKVTVLSSSLNLSLKKSKLNEDW
ncbi:hypothetical protein [Cellulophaga sp. Hel_I_12]|uniref:hypothetical protein n=1 Tax=Cellulophaga sp. Hel_I_12 TaxID=1249972 RepID=UPI00064567D1|nr:hypothetical protein [Cellulophaga sp. Hel_I_12]